MEKIQKGIMNNFCIAEVWKRYDLEIILGVSKIRSGVERLDRNGQCSTSSNVRMRGH